MGSAKVNVKKMRAFDLKAGDEIRALDSILGERSDFRVIRIFPHIFEAERVDNGMIRYFRNADYMVGLLNKKAA